jgi:hypothetical protein
MGFALQCANSQASSIGIGTDAISSALGAERAADGKRSPPKRSGSPGGRAITGRCKREMNGGLQSKKGIKTAATWSDGRGRSDTTVTIGVASVREY